MLKVFLISIVIMVNSLIAQIKVEKISLNQVDELIKNRNNKPLLLNIWATWCIPCREEFPDLVKLFDNFSNKIDVIAISVDYPDEIDSKIIPFLKKNSANFPVYVNGERDVEKFINLFDSNWNGAIPATFIYNISGKKVESYYEKKDYYFFEQSIKKYLK